jgi:GEVED domain-containing protein
MPRALGIALLLLPALLFAPDALAQSDVDGPDCGRVIQDFGDAPEGMPYSYWHDGAGRFPTCLAAGLMGTMETSCAARGTAPGPTGYMKHVLDGTANYWLRGACNPTSLTGVDDDLDGKVSYPGAGPSACNAAVSTDPPPSPFVNHGQDEYDYMNEEADAGVYSSSFMIDCYQGVVFFGTASCGPERTAYLNILVDLNSDGDWNDNGPSCVTGGPCVHEWAVKNRPIVIASGCQDHDSGSFPVGPFTGTGETWMRVSLTDGPVDDDYPWAGSANRPGGAYAGGETEDYKATIAVGDPVINSSWGGVKIRYR